MSELTGEPQPGGAPIEAIATKSRVDKPVTGLTPTLVAEPVLDIKQIIKEHINPRIISKKTDQEGRKQTAEAIMEVRTNTRANQSGREQKQEQIAVSRSNSYQKEREKTQELTRRMKSLIVKTKGLFGLKDRRSIELQTEIDTIKSERKALNEEDHRIRILKEKENQKGIPNPKQLLEAYYERIATQPLSNEQKRDLLKPEVLASLSTEEYIALWKRLNPHFLTHVTRQGFRDHGAMSYHSAGLYDFHNGFLGALEDDKNLRPMFALQGLRTRDEASVKNFLESWVLQANDIDEAKARFDKVMNSTYASAPNYPDKTSVHFAAQLVANEYYGGESGNEVFYVYPSDTLASQHNFAFNGKKKDFTQPQNETAWNNIFIWPNTTDNPGIPLDAGIVFLPESTLVDPNTGSKYASEVRVVDGEEKRVMVEDAKLVNNFVEWGKNLDEQSKIRQTVQEYIDEKDDYWLNTKELVRERSLVIIAKELQRLGFTSDAAVSLGSKLFVDLKLGTELNNDTLQDIIEKSGAQWKRAENAVSAKVYWEGFFAKNPQLRPKHIQYYNGSPNLGIVKFLQTNNIGRADTSDTEGKLLGFDDRHVVLKGGENIPGLIVEDEDPRAMVGYKELYGTANKIIEEHYQRGT
jgi:hypothetical protein